MKTFCSSRAINKKSRISNLNERDLQNLINRSVLVLLKELSKYTSKENIQLFKKGKTSLLDIGICNGITLLLDKKLQTINKNICILAHDTLNKFKLDIEKEF